MSHARADAPLPSAVPAPAVPKVVSLATALTTMPESSVPHGSVVLTAQPQAVMPVPPPSPLDPLSAEGTVPTPDNIAVRYRRSFQTFGHVIALAPPTMTVLASNPDIANLPLSQLAAQHPTPFLLGTLTPAQLRRMSTTGLAFRDLTTEQQALLKAALPHPFQVIPKASQLPSYTMDELKTTGAERAEIDEQFAEASKLYTAQTRTIPDERLTASLRLYGFLAPEFIFDGPENNSISVGYSQNGFETTGADKLANNSLVMGLPGDNTMEAVLRAEVPNAPKDSDLRWNRRDLEPTISLQGLKTVDDLVARLAKTTKLELYADPRYSSQPLLARGDLSTAQPAGDVMPALALCVCGAWRQVGPAFVLTDDVSGLGARQSFLREMVQIWSNRLSTSGEAVGGHLRDLDWMHTLQFAPGDLGALSSTQTEAIIKENNSNNGHLPWKDLPTPLQAGLRGQLTHHYDGEGMNSFEATANSIAKSLKPDSSVDINLVLRLGVALPDTGIMTLGAPYRVQMPPPPPPPSATVSDPPKAQANSVTADKPLRGILCAPKTPEEARAVVAQLPKMGLNTLFLDVFTNGRAYFSNHSLPPPSAKAGSVLQAALDAAKSSQIAVYAVVDTLCWRKDGAAVHPQPWPSGFSEDLTITGEAPDRSVQRQLAAHSIRSDFDRDYEMTRSGSQGWASPLDPAVRNMLTGLVSDLATTQGLAGLVFQDTVPPGYFGSETEPYEEREEGTGLGYTLANRLTYLRAYHLDPIDLSSNFDNLQLWLPTDGFQVSFDVSVPGFQPSFGADGDRWKSLRGDADKSLLADCFAAAATSQPTLPLFMRERQMGVTFDPWTDPKKLNQYASTDTMSYPFRQITPRSILSIPYGPYERARPERFVWVAKDYGPAGEDGKRAGGEVFDLVTGGPPENLLDALDKLNVFLRKPTSPLPSPQ